MRVRNEGTHQSNATAPTKGADRRWTGGEASGEQFSQARDALMREAVANPNEYGLKFMGERMPFEGQTLPQGEVPPPASNEQMSEKDMHDEALADFEARQSDINFSREQGHTEGFEGKPYHEMEQEELDADKKRFYGMYPHLNPQEEGGFDPDAEAEHMKRIMTSRDVAIRDAWFLLKSRTIIPDELRAGHYDSPGERERKEMAIRQLQEEAYENDPRTIQLREEKRRQGMAEMDRQAEEFATQYQQQTGKPLED